jgi:hypothetical protein
MSLVTGVLEDERVQEFWPGIVGAIVIAVGQIYLLLQGTETPLLGIPLFLGIAVTLLLEVGRWGWGQLQTEHA